MEIKGIIDVDLVNYKKISMTVMFPHCTFKCGAEYCQNSELAKSRSLNVSVQYIVKLYLESGICESLLFQGLEPFDSWDDLIELVSEFRKHTDDDIVVYSGYTPTEVHDKINILKQYKNIIVKFGRYIPNRESRFDEVLGVTLASDNQFAERIS